ncbi:hypothetical protein DF268_35865 [Streptomyces sp. V2]|uniref:hypothetical protein n=1 Tax=Streptomyces sp. V2 TaxID=1424099 RepID=UPI000D66F4C0|nr:hypothetical protein [Streptomyces sp. V2]PWG08752.1 hypothetical protein DF268_35865 [Streptomyces sp. V2]
MSSALSTYLGWDAPRHLPGCKRPSWDVSVRTDDHRFRSEHGGGRHQCVNDVCDHGGEIRRTTVRVVCPSCLSAMVVRGEREGITEGHAARVADGYGLKPRTAAGLLLWPGRPWMRSTGPDAPDPHDFVVTRPGVKAVTEADVVGEIGMGRGRRGSVIWTALAVPDPKGEFGTLMSFAVCNDGHGQGGGTLRSLGAAARWVAARLAERDQEPGGGAR